MAAGVLSVEDIQYGYCTEFIIRLDKNVNIMFDEQRFRQELSKLGDSLLVIADEELVKVHIHAEKLDQVMRLAQSFGQLINIKIENMREQFLQVQERSSQLNRSDKPLTFDLGKNVKRFGIITVAMGAGLTNIFKSLGADVVIAGGQTMNPSTQDFVQASQQIEAEQFIILPNNGNILLAANQAVQLIDRPTIVIPTKNIPQGLAALLSFNADSTLAENKMSMSQAMEQVTAGQVTYAIRDSQLSDLEIKKGQFMGIMNGEIMIAADDAETCTSELVSKMISSESEIITLIYGQDVEQNQAMLLAEQLENHYPDMEIEVHDGGQPVYAYLISIE